MAKNTTLERYLIDNIKKDLEQKMVFLVGPRQVGKTSVAKKLLTNLDGYMNWDIPIHRQAILSQTFPNSELWVFDEIHRYRKWRNYLKGVYDQHREDYKILVTGSARLDFYRFGGDSLQGRYHLLRLFPLSLAELKTQSQSDLEQLLQLGGFPEPFLSGSEENAKRWSLEYRSRLIQEEITTIEQVKDLGTLELLMLRLPELVGSPLSLNALREDLQVSFDSVKHWIEIFERFYAIFRLPPFGATKIKAVKKEQKHYHFDWTLVKARSFRFENLVALHLLKWVSYLRDTKGRELELRYFRDTTGREVDFVITEERKPIQFIECKESITDVSPAISYLKGKFPMVDAYQIYLDGSKDYINRDGVRVMAARTFLKDLV